MSTYKTYIAQGKRQGLVAIHLTIMDPESRQPFPKKIIQTAYAGIPGKKRNNIRDQCQQKNQDQDIALEGMLIVIDQILVPGWKETSRYILR